MNEKKKLYIFFLVLSFFLFLFLFLGLDGHGADAAAAGVDQDLAAGKGLLASQRADGRAQALDHRQRHQRKRRRL
jgi:hypothetical protein